MYTLVRRYIKTGIVFLFVGLGLGVWILVGREIGGRFPDPYLVSAHVHAVGIGFVLFLILGVALWLFPRAAKDDRRYRPGRVEAAYWILAIGTAVRIAGETARALVDPVPWLAWAVVASGVAQASGVGLYFWSMWTRIRPVGSHLREARGERF